MRDLLTSAPAYGTLRVGGYVFNNYTETSLDVKPVPRLDDRGVAFSEAVVHLRTTLCQPTAQSELSAVLPLLQRAGVPITYAGRGLDRLLLAMGVGRVRDVAWGPMPGSVRVKAHGVPAQNIQLEFTITARIPFCPTARFAGPIDLAATVSFEPDYAGRVTRVWSGRLRIANNTRPDGRGGYDSPDLYREDVIPDLLPNHYREFGPFVTSEDRTELRFEVRDVPRASRNIPPPFVVGKPECTQHVASVGKGLRTWIEYFTGKYEMSPDCPDIYIPARHFLQVYVGGRIEWLRKALGTNTKEGGPSSIVPLSFNAGSTNDLDAPIATFAATFKFVCPPGDVIAASALWRPVDGVSWAAYEQSLIGSAFNPWGVSGIYFDPTDDNLLGGLCGPPGEVDAGDVSRILRGTRPGFDPGEWFDVLIRSITPQASWVEYENKLTLVPESGNVELRSLPKKKLPDATGTGLGAVVGSAAAAAFDAGTAGTWNDMIAGALGSVGRLAAGAVGAAARPSAQQRVPDRFRIVMEGHAVRAKFLIDPPALTEVGGVDVLPMYDRGKDYYVPSTVIRDAGGCPLYGSAWRLTYMPKTFPLKKPIEPLPNPMLDPE